MGSHRIGIVLGALALLVALVGVTVLQAHAQSKPDKGNDQGVVSLRLGF
ncbi:MAG: hypothetical protein L6R19_28550 [Alphaproteobacteria bacterium]|nr:hypothetical protein [Alphaproteobacteria bacterium]